MKLSKYPELTFVPKDGNLSSIYDLYLCIVQKIFKGKNSFLVPFLKTGKKIQLKVVSNTSQKDNKSNGLFFVQSEDQALIRINLKNFYFGSIYFNKYQAIKLRETILHELVHYYDLCHDPLFPPRPNLDSDHDYYNDTYEVRAFIFTIKDHLKCNGCLNFYFARKSAKVAKFNKNFSYQ